MESHWFNSIQFNSIQFNSIQFNSIQFNSIQFNSIQFNSFFILFFFIIIISIMDNWIPSSKPILSDLCSIHVQQDWVTGKFRWVPSSQDLLRSIRTVCSWNNSWNFWERGCEIQPKSLHLSERNPWRPFSSSLTCLPTSHHLNGCSSPSWRSCGLLPVKISFWPSSSLKECARRLQSWKMMVLLMSLILWPRLRRDSSKITNPCNWLPSMVFFTCWKPKSPW